MGLRYSNKELNQMQKDTRFDIDEKFAEKIGSYKIDKKDPWAKAVKKACFAKPKWYIRIWGWVKGLFGYKPKNIPRPAVLMDPRFDFQEWVIERKEKIIEAIKKDGKDKNTITCPICYKDREYYLSPFNKHIHSTCKYCGIKIAP